MPCRDFSLNSHLKKADNCVSVAVENAIAKHLSVFEILHKRKSLGISFSLFTPNILSKYLGFLIAHLYEYTFPLSS